MNEKRREKKRRIKALRQAVNMELKAVSYTHLTLPTIPFV